MKKHVWQALTNANVEIAGLEDRVDILEDAIADAAMAYAASRRPVIVYPTRCSDTLRDLASWHLTEGVTLDTARADPKRWQPFPPIAGAVCTTVEDVCVKVDQDKDVILTEIDSTADITQTEADAHADAINTKIDNAESSIKGTSNQSVTQLLNAMVAYLDATVGTVAIPVLQTRLRLGVDDTDPTTVFGTLNLQSAAIQAAQDRLNDVYSVVNTINGKLGALAAGSDTVKTNFTAVATATSGIAAQNTTMTTKLNAVGVVVDDTKLETAGISAALIVQFIKWVGGTVAVPLVDMLLGNGAAPPITDLAALTAIDVVSGQSEDIPPGWYGLELNIDALPSAAHRFGNPNFYYPPIAYLTWYGVTGWLRPPEPVNIEFSQFYPLPAGATSFAVELAGGSSGTYTALVIPS